MAKHDRAQLVEDLKQIRDEIQLKIHLAAADARDEWDDLEKKFDHLRGHAERVGKVAEDAAGEVGEALDLLGKELKAGYDRIRKVL